MRRSEIARALGVPPDDRAGFRRILRALADRGEITVIRRNRYVRTREADLAVGILHLTDRGFGFLIPDDGSPEIYIAPEHTSTAMHRDRVLVRILSGPAGVRRRGAPAGAEKKSAGKVVRIIERANDTIVGTLRRTRHFFYVIPDDPRFSHDVYVPKPADRKAEPGMKVVVRLLPWENRHVNPEGEVVEVLGRSGRPEIEILSIIRKHRLPQIFPAPVEKAAKRFKPRVTDRDRSGREDLRDLLLFTIDPEDARDYDDAVSIEKTSGGGWKLGVHIADVSHYVRPGTALDREARERAVSVYLVDRVIPMLPLELSAGICSLRENEDRLARSVFIWIDSNRRPMRHRVVSSVIRSRRRFTYAEVQAILEGDTDGAPAEIVKAVRSMDRLASALRARRFERGAIDLDMPEARVVLDDRARPTGVRIEKNNRSHQLIEEFMLLANGAIARHLVHARYPGIFRVHDPPAQERLEGFAAFVRSLGYRPGASLSRDAVSAVLRRARGRPEEHAVKVALLRSMKRAVYSTKPTAHFGLAVRPYLHFTSPIRRYADLVVHRILDACLRGEPAGVEPEELARIAQHITRREQAAEEAERDSQDLMKMALLQRQIEKGPLQTYDAVITEVRNFGLFIELPDLMVNGLVHIGQLGGDLYRFDRGRSALVGRSSGERFRAGQLLRVVPARVDPYKRQYDFALARD